MLQLAGAFVGKSVLSLRTGGVVGTTISAIINPKNLKIEGFYCADRFSKNRLILLSQEIREVIADGIVVNDHEAMSEAGELVRLKDIISIGFDLTGKTVITTSKQKLGKVEDYAVDTSSMYIQKLYVAQPLMKNFRGGQLSIDRSQISEITNRKIVVQEPTIRSGKPIQATSPVIA